LLVTWIVRDFSVVTCWLLTVSIDVSSGSSSSCADRDSSVV
jgi:hypothetical protein